jgi:hypothetical protein
MTFAAFALVSFSEETRVDAVNGSLQGALCTPREARFLHQKDSSGTSNTTRSAALIVSHRTLIVGIISETKNLATEIFPT